MKALYKHTIVIWSEESMRGVELSDLAREAESGSAYCAMHEIAHIADPKADPTWDGTEFFDVGADDEESVVSTYCGSMSDEELREHVKGCEPCAKEFAASGQRATARDEQEQ